MLMLEMDRFRLRQDPEVLIQSLPFQCFRPSLSLCFCHDAASLPGPMVPLGTVVVTDAITKAQVSFARQSHSCNQWCMLIYTSAPHNETKTTLTLTPGPTEGEERTG